MRTTQISERELNQKPDQNWTDLGAAGCLRRRAEKNPDAIALRYLRKGGSETTEHSFRALDLEARRLAAWLRRNGSPGDRVLLAHAPGPEFVSAFFACLYAGFVAVPAFPPRKARHDDRVGKILRDADCSLALADGLGRAALEAALADDAGPWKGLRWPASDDLAGLAPLPVGDLNRPALDDLAFLQYTSGSTGTPKGVMVTHGNLLHNLNAQAAQLDFRPGDVFVSWVPFFHDMGLVLGLLLPLHGDGAGVYLPPNDFLKCPADWLKALSAFRGTHSCAPNFAFDLCVRCVGPEEREGLDLSRWRYCGNGSEPVRPEAMRRFEAGFAAQGVRPGLVQPGYGLAENTLYVTANPPLSEAVLWDGHGGSAGRSLAGCGQAPGHQVLVVDPLTGRTRGDGEAGEVWVQGGSVAKGYWRRPEESLATFGATLPGHAGTFLRTGDLGFWHRGSLVVNGRLKDLVIVRGVNYHPEDLEATVRADAPEPLGLGAAFAVEGPEGEELVLVQEVPRHPATSLDALAEGIAQSLSREHGVRVMDLLLVPPHAVPTTSSGKVQRRACRSAYLEGGLKIMARWPRAAEAPASAAQVPAEGPSYADRLAFVRETALALGGVEPSEGDRASLDAWCLNSLHVAELSAVYEKKYGKDLEALTRPGVALCELLGGGTAEGGAAEKPVAPGVSAPVVAPVSAPAQPRPLAAPPETPRHGSEARRWRCHSALESLWAFQEMNPGSNAYHQAWTLELDSRLDVDILRAALIRLTEAETALRSGFELDEEGRLWQVEAPVSVPLDLPWNAPGGLAQAKAWAQAWNRVPFKTGAAPLWKFAYLPLEQGSLLAFTFHHLIFDRRSAEAFLEVLEGLLRDPEAMLPRSGDPPRFMADPEALERARAYWSERLEGLKPETWLQTGAGTKPGPPKTLQASVPAETLAVLKRLAAGEQCTPFTVAACAWAEAVSEQSGDGEACFAIPSTLRDEPLSERRLGYWVHPFPLRLGVDRGKPVGVRLGEAKQALRAGLAHRRINMAEAMRLAALASPLSMLNYHGKAADFAGFLGLRSRLEALEPDTASAPLYLAVEETDAWTLRLEYDSSRVDRGTAERCLAAFTGACARYAGQTAAPRLSLLKGAALENPEYSTVIDAFHAQAQRHPQAPALISDQGRIDYGTLAAQARSVAGILVQAGIKPGDRVAVCSQASPAWVAALLGCFELSAVYVPLDPAYPPERLKAMLEDAACGAVLSDQARPAWSSDWPGPWMDLGQSLTSRTPYLRQPGRPRPEDPAYVIFTSGSTGRPKGVQVSHRALLNNALSVAKRLGLGSQDRVLQCISISFDPSLQELMPILSCGGSVVLGGRKNTPLGAVEMAALIKKYEVSLSLFPAAYWHALMRDGGTDYFRELSSLRSVIVGGEAPLPSLVRGWNRDLPLVKLYNAYGPTEACICVTLFECKPDETADGPVPLGLPLPGVELAVVGQDGNALPWGELGELWIAGTCLADGYVRPEGDLDRAKFGAAAPDGREARAFYRTGDLAFVDPRGRLVHKGRLDREFKAAGIRMDLGEIESALARADGVANAVVEAEGKGEALKLRAWVLAKTGRRPEPTHLMAWLRQRIHAACVPSEMTVLTAFPLSPNGKIDRVALGAMTQAPMPEQSRFAGLPPESPAINAAPEVLPWLVPKPAETFTQRLCEAFSKILNRTVKPEDDFFALGGSSLQAVRLAGEASRRLERNVLVDQIYQAPNPRALSKLLLDGLGRPDAVVGNELLRPLSEGPGPAWILLPPGSGRLACYSGLARLLQGRAKVWGMNLGALPAPAEGAWNTWVESCAQALERALPHGDLVMGGWSMGGLLATDLCRALVARGRGVRRLLLLDTFLPDPLNRALIEHDPFVLEDGIRRDLEAGGEAPQGQAGEEERKRYQRYLSATANYTLHPISVPVSLVVSERTAREDSRNSWMAWSLMAKVGMTCRLVPGDHHSVLSENNLKRLAEFLLRDLAGEPMERLVAA